MSSPILLSPNKEKPIVEFSGKNKVCFKIDELEIDRDGFPLLSEEIFLRRAMMSKVLVDVFKGARRERSFFVAEEDEINHEISEMVSGLDLCFSTIDGKKTETSIKNARKRWEDSLKKANGDLEKAEQIYDSL